MVRAKLRRIVAGRGELGSDLGYDCRAVLIEISRQLPQEVAVGLVLATF